LPQKIQRKKCRHPATGDHERSEDDSPQGQGNGRQWNDHAKAHEKQNNEEKENDPRIEAKADFHIDWPHVEPHDIHELNPYVDNPNGINK
jgi:hypothetical protein